MSPILKYVAIWFIASSLVTPAKAGDLKNCSTQLAKLSSTVSSLHKWSKNPQIKNRMDWAAAVAIFGSGLVAMPIGLKALDKQAYIDFFFGPGVEFVAELQGDEYLGKGIVLDMGEVYSVLGKTFQEQAELHAQISKRPESEREEFFKETLSRYIPEVGHYYQRVQWPQFERVGELTPEKPDSGAYYTEVNIPDQVARMGLSSIYKNYYQREILKHSNSMYSGDLVDQLQDQIIRRLVDELEGDYEQNVADAEAPIARRQKAHELLSSSGCTNRGICRHKALALMGILNQIGIPSVYVSGTKDAYAREGHAWVRLTDRDLVADPTEGVVIDSNDYSEQYGYPSHRQYFINPRSDESPRRHNF